MLEQTLALESSSLYQEQMVLMSQQHSSPRTAQTLVESDIPTNGKKIVLFLDGTSNEFGTNPHTNVLRLFQMTLMDEPGQVCYYQPGIGARFEEESEDNWYTNMLDEAIATSLSRHVVAAYNYIVSQYEPGDKIYLFGFSRGSFTCRVLAGMIERVGLIYRGLEHLTHQAWEYYSNWVKSLEQAQSDDQRALYEVFRETFCRSNVDIYFMGIFDSVNSVGLLRDKVFPYVVRSSNVTHVRHAISLDERRAKFKDLFIKDNEARIHESEVKPNTSFKELVFSGNHGDIGGGWHPDTWVSGTDKPTDASDPWDKEWRYLSGVLMRWLLREAIELGVLFQPIDIERFNNTQAIQYSIFGYWHDILSFRSSPQVKPSFTLRPAETKDTIQISPLIRIKVPSGLHVLEKQPPTALERFDGRGYGSYLKTLFWWILECVPFAVKVDKLCDVKTPKIETSGSNGIKKTTNHQRRRKFSTIITPNFGKHRNIGFTADYHWSVFYRIHFVSDYKPRNIKYVNLIPNEEKWSLGAKFINLMKTKEQLFKKLQLWTDIELFATELNKLSNDSPQDYIKLIKEDDSKFWSFIPDDLV